MPSPWPNAENLCTALGWQCMPSRGLLRKSLVRRIGDALLQLSQDGLDNVLLVLWAAVIQDEHAIHALSCPESRSASKSATNRTRPSCSAAISSVTCGSTESNQQFSPWSEAQGNPKAAWRFPLWSRAQVNLRSGPQLVLE